MMIKKAYFKLFVFIIFIAVVFLGSCEEFEDETYEMNAIDSLAGKSIVDTVFNNVATAILSRWTGLYDTTISFEDTLTDIYEIVVSSDTSGTGTITYDTTYKFIYDGSFTVLDTLTYSISSGEDTMIVFDTSFVITDTVESADTVLSYENEISLHKEYPLRFIISKFADGQKDTVLSKDLDYSLDMDDIFTNLNSEDRFISTSDTCYQIRTSPDSARTYLVFYSDKSSEVTFFFDDYLKMDLMRVEGPNVNALPLIEDSIPLETVAGYPEIRSRFVYQLEDEKYLLRLTTIEQTMATTFRAAILYQIEH